MPDLSNTIALVTGASRGAGRGIAHELGAAGATVYMTSRGSLDETAELVASAGGTPKPLRCDHTDDAATQKVFATITEEAGRLDVLVNNVWGGYEDHDDSFMDRFWKQPINRFDKMFQAGLRAHYVAAQHAAPMMIEAKKGLIISTTAWDRDKFLGSVPYDTIKSAIHRMVYGMSLELHEHNVTALSLAPGWMRTEAVLEVFETDEEHWEENDELAPTESPRYVGRAVAHLAADPSVHAYAGRVLTVGDLARSYGFTDYDGRQPPAFLIADEYLWD